MPLRKRGADATQRVQMLRRGCRCYSEGAMLQRKRGADATAQRGQMLLILAQMLLHAHGAQRVWVHPR